MMEIQLKVSVTEYRPVHYGFFWGKHRRQTKKLQRSAPAEVVQPSPNLPAPQKFVQIPQLPQKFVQRGHNSPAAEEMFTT